LDKRIGWVSATDNPDGNPMLPADWLVGKLSEFAPNLVLYLTCKDYNRAGLESNLWRYAADGFNNVLVLSGEPFDNRLSYNFLRVYLILMPLIFCDFLRTN
jgi:5,10-methylenetetrahydrofolate reductase